MDHIGQVLDNKYKLIQVLGEGGMGAVFLGQHLVLGRRVAIKFIHAELTKDAEAVKRFYREAQAASVINHKNIIEVFDVGLAPWAEPFIVMEYLEGESLSSVIKRTGKMPLAAACAVMEPALLALEAAHDKGIVHRDIKPDNIFIAQSQDEPPQVKLIDFGISKFTRTPDQTKLTRTGSLIGTPEYMAPEQARGISEIDHAVDVYAMGMVLYEMLTGELPYTGENYNSLIVSILTGEPKSLQKSNPGLSDRINTIVMRAISKDPSERHQSAAELLSELKTLAEFDDRQESLTRLSFENGGKDVAAGDLGTVRSESNEEFISAVFGASMDAATPRAWTESDVARARAKTRWLVGVGIGLAAFGIAAFLFWTKGPRDTVVVSPSAEVASQASSSAVPPPVESQTVSIAVKGVPPEAKIYCDGELQTANPFRIPRDGRQRSLRLSAPTHESYETAFIPIRDITIDVELKPLIKVGRSEKKGTLKKTKPKKREERPPADSPSNQERKESKKLQQGGRGAEFAEDFE